MQTKAEVLEETHDLVQDIAMMCQKGNIKAIIHVDIKHKPIKKPFPRAKYHTFWEYDCVLKRNVLLGYWM